MQEDALCRWVLVEGAKILWAEDGTIKAIVLPPDKETTVEAVEDLFHREQMLRVLKELRPEATK